MTSRLPIHFIKDELLHGVCAYLPHILLVDVSYTIQITTIEELKGRGLKSHNVGTVHLNTKIGNLQKKKNQ